VTRCVVTRQSSGQTLSARYRIVRRAAQTGVVVGVRREIDVRLSTGAVKTNVPTDTLEPVLRFQPDQYVLHSGWLGRIDFVEEAVTVRARRSRAGRLSAPTAPALPQRGRKGMRALP
jgi:hypothetical protein